MSEAGGRERSNTNTFVADSDGYILISTPPSSNGESHRSIPLVTFCRDHEGNSNNENGVNRIMLFSDIPERKYNLQTKENLITMIKIRSKLVLIGIICAVILLFQIPIILYYTDQPTVDLFTIPEVDIDTCSVMQPSAKELLTKCGITNLTEDCINSSAITSLHTVYALGSVIEQSCTEDALPFFCNATLFLCSESESHDLTSMCLNVRDRDCALEWRLVETVLNTSVPDCTSFEMNSNLTFTKSPLPSCPDQFDIFCDSICLPVCGEYAPFTVGGNFYYIFLSIWGGVGIIGGIVTLIKCYFNRQKLFRFPQIYIVYNTIVSSVFLLLLVLPIILRLAGNSSLVCSDHNFFVSLNEPTTFCQAQGFLLHFGFLSFLGFWCFHLFHLFQGLAYPYQAKHWMDSRKIRTRIHITEVFIVLVLGLLPPIITISVSNYQDDGLFCSPRSVTIMFYGEMVPYVIMGTVGLSLLFCSLWILRKKHHLESNNVAVSKMFCLHCRIPETKLYLLFFYYAITMTFFIYSLVSFLLSIDNYNMYSNEYILCSAGGYKEECEIQREKVRESFIVTFVFSILNTILVSFINLSHLMYVVNIPEMIRSTKKYLVICCK